ncbi:archaetidylserine decarboxylase [Pantoea sp. Aalb]|uniref:archaetidylserine decarboxylase n=1 Tax=Pantoea sp. Aalb TaxID=2576762 RepID=UPI0013260AE7|nr:archaetidylserine decarboxylase [Pantoea sp. Aalb]MXP67669.1 phosphatidylserine decarboxylase [Pantoea sp. Aalb]
MFDSLKVILIKIMPKKLLTKMISWIANFQGGWLTTTMINIFIWFYKVDMSEALYSNSSSYCTFNDFFIRPLKKNMRLINFDTSLLVMPVDGIISQLGRIEGNQMFQAKNHYYSLQALLAGNNNLANYFLNGYFVNIYLSLRDYHRVHMPCNSTLREMIYIPGKLYSVNRSATRKIPNLFARNERVICVFDTNHGPMIQILVGAIIVGSIETSWVGTITTPREGMVKRWRYPSAGHNGAIVLLKGQEMGRFKLGSTVINLFAPNQIKLLEHLKPESKTRVGQPLATVLPNLNNITLE